MNVCVYDDSWGMDFQAQPEELFLQVYQFLSNKNSLRICLTLVGFNVLT